MRLDAIVHIPPNREVINPGCRSSQWTCPLTADMVSSPEEVPLHVLREDHARHHAAGNIAGLEPVL
jgi:hypothetical protein